MLLGQVVSKAKKYVSPMNYQKNSLGYCLIDIKVTVYGNTMNIIYQNIYVFFLKTKTNHIIWFKPYHITYLLT